MSGPSLHKLDAHRSIHDGVVTEGRDLLEVLRQVYEEKHEKHSLLAANALIEHWETRLLAHADSEEEGLYVKYKKEYPKSQEKLTMLKRDHDLLRMLVNETKEIIAEKGVNDMVIDRFTAIYVLAQMHNREEETLLFADEAEVGKQTG